MSGQFHWHPESYLELAKAEVPRFDELQDEAIAAIDRPPARVLELGIGTGETTRRLLAAYPDAAITGLDSSPEMVFRARELGIEVRLGRMEDPLPDGPWDLVIAVLSVHHLSGDRKLELYRRVREQARALVIGDVVAVSESERVAPLDPGFDMPERAEQQAEACGGEIRWRADDLAVIAASYD